MLYDVLLFLFVVCLVSCSFAGFLFAVLVVCRIGLVFACRRLTPLKMSSVNSTYFLYVVKQRTKTLTKTNKKTENIKILLKLSL